MKKYNAVGLVSNMKNLEMKLEVHLPWPGCIVEHRFVYPEECDRAVL